jgi:hypothetical protein
MVWKTAGRPLLGRGRRHRPPLACLGLGSLEQERPGTLDARACHTPVRERPARDSWACSSSSTRAPHGAAGLILGPGRGRQAPRRARLAHDGAPTPAVAARCRQGRSSPSTRARLLSGDSLAAAGATALVGGGYRGWGGPHPFIMGILASDGPFGPVSQAGPACWPPGRCLARLAGRLCGFQGLI